MFTISTASEEFGIAKKSLSMKVFMPTGTSVPIMAFSQKKKSQHSTSQQQQGNMRAGKRRAQRDFEILRKSTWSVSMGLRGAVGVAYGEWPSAAAATCGVMVHTSVHS
jgi:hypothetical protein